MPSINQSVGRGGDGGDNQAADIKIVQELLNKNRHLLLPLPAIRTDGVLDNATITAIETFQRRVALVNPPDGRVDPNGNTLAKLNENARSGPVPRLPLFPLRRRPTANYKLPNSGGRHFGAGRGSNRRHAACDLLQPPNTEVLAMEDGVVLFNPALFRDETVDLAIDHGSYVVRYGELKSNPLGMLAGVRVTRGQVIGFVGRLNSGASMLHLEMYSGTKSGSLTVSGNQFVRRSDLIDSTEFLDIATFDRNPGVVPPPLVNGRGSGRVSSRVETILNLRSAANPSSASLAQLSAGSALQILQAVTGANYNADGTTRNDWLEVKVNGRQGFVAAFFVDIEFQTGRVSSRVSSQLNLRESPATSATVMASLSPGTTFKILETVTGSTYDANGTSRNDWFKVEHNGMQGFVAVFFVDLIESGSDGDNPNAILFTFESRGASDATASQDRLPERGIRGVRASETMAETDRSRVMAHKSKFIAAARPFNFPPALLAAIASRESRGGNVLDASGRGDNGHGFGIMQVDDRNPFPVVTTGGPFGQPHINQATGILKDKLEGVESETTALSDSAQLQTAVSRYNGGNRLPAPRSDEGTTGGDYMNDVWARARYYATQESWT